MQRTDDLLDSADGDFPKPGARLRFRGVQPFWFVDVVANAERELRIGDVYTVKTIRVYSSWAEITLEETDEVQYNHIWFETL
jgi:hypothetical protein